MPQEGTITMTRKQLQDALLTAREGGFQAGVDTILEIIKALKRDNSVVERNTIMGLQK